MADQPKKVIYLAVRRPSPKDVIDDALSSYLLDDKNYLDNKTGLYLLDEKAPA